MRFQEYLKEAKEFKALVKDKKTKQVTTITSSYNSKKEFINDLKSNGYIVDPKKVKLSKDFDYIINKTNAEEWDWLGITQDEYLKKSYKKIMGRK